MHLTMLGECAQMWTDIMRRLWLCMYIEIFMFKSDSLLLLTKINASIKAIKIWLKCIQRKWGTC